LPAETSVNARAPESGVGRRSTVVPKSVDPQQYTCPEASPHVCSPPAAMSLNVSGLLTGVGA
jgi:hypothetical protein